MPGHSVCDDGLVIDLRALNHVTVDPVARRATVGGGALLGDVDRATQEHGLVVPAGVVSHTGAGGLTLGGGVGRLMRRFGLTIDSLIRAEVVTADGACVRASASEHADLFWALRGGGGNFGVVTEFEFALHELTDLVILATFHPLACARDVITRARDTMGPGAPDELLWTSFLRRANDVPWIPDELVGAHGIMSLVEWSGADLDAGRALLNEIQTELAPLATDLAVVPFLTMQTITDELFAHGMRTSIKAGFVDDLDDGLVDALLERAPLMARPRRASSGSRRSTTGKYQTLVASIALVVKAIANPDGVMSTATGKGPAVVFFRARDALRARLPVAKRQAVVSREPSNGQL